MWHHPPITTPCPSNYSPAWCQPLLLTSPSTANVTTDIWDALYLRQAFRVTWEIQPNRISLERASEMKSSAPLPKSQAVVLLSARSLRGQSPASHTDTWQAKGRGPISLFVLPWLLHLMKPVSCPQHENWGDYL